MKKTSKKLLSFFLAVVMIVTSCSVGFTAFAEDKNAASDSYWNDVTEAKDAFDAIDGIITYALPSILNMEINGEKIYSSLGWSKQQAQTATLQEVLAKASPQIADLLSGLLSLPSGSSKTATRDLETFLRNHSTISGLAKGTTGKWEVFSKYYTYLIDPKAGDNDISFIDLYNFCEANKSNAEPEIAEYCTQTLDRLNTLMGYLNGFLNDSAEGYNTKKRNAYIAYDALRKAIVKKDKTFLGKGASLEEIGEFVVPAFTFKNVAKETVSIASMSINELIENPYFNNGISEAQTALYKSGSTAKISTVAEALVYYYSFTTGLQTFCPTNNYAAPSIAAARNGSTYQNAAEYIRLAQLGGTPLNTKRIGGSVDEKLTVNNYEALVKSYVKQLRDNGDERFAGYVEGSNEYFYITKAVVECLGDLLDDSTSLTLETAKKQGKLDAFASSSFESINIATLAERELIVRADDKSFTYSEAREYAKKKINDVKITERQYKLLWAAAKEPHLKNSKDFKTFIKSNNCDLSPEAKKFLTQNSMSDGDLNDFYQNLKRAETFEDAKNIVCPINNSRYNLYKYTVFRHPDDARVNPVDFFNEIASGYVTYNAFSTVTGQYGDISSPIYDSIENEYYKTIKTHFSENSIQYRYTAKDKDGKFLFKMENEKVINAYNESTQGSYADVESLNTLLNEKVFDALLNENDPSGIGYLVKSLVDSDIVLYKDAAGNETGVLKDLWLNLYNKPVETIFNILPVLMVVVDEFLVPTVINGENTYLGTSAPVDANHTSPLISLSALLETLGASLLVSVKDENGKDTSAKQINRDSNGKIGAGSIIKTLDLNTVLPIALAYLSGNDAYKTAAVAKYAKGGALTTYGDYLQSNGFSNIREDSTDSKSRLVDNVKVITGFYIVDKYLENFDIMDIVKDSNGKLDATLATGLNELIQEVGSFGYEAADEYLDDCKNDSSHADYRYTKADATKEIAIAQTGLNNIPVALPNLLDRLGKKFFKKYGVNTDWTYLYSGKFSSKSKTFSNGTATQTTNARLEEFKAGASREANTENAVNNLDAFMNALVGTWINGLLDFLNDALTTDNKLTYNIPLIAGLLNSIGGISETSVITDILNGFFGLTREDTASFTFKNRAVKNFSGLSVESGYFLIANVVYFDKTTKEAKGLIPLIESIKAGVAAQTPNKSGSASTDSNKTESKPAETKKPTLVNSSKANKKYNKDKVLTSKNIKTANDLLSKLDTLLASLLANSSLNDFALNSNENILAGVLTTASNYIGEKNSNSLLTLIDEYLKVFDTTAKDGKVDSDKVYSDSNLSNLVISTYRLLENIIGYVFYDPSSGVLRGCDPHHTIASAINGVYSPDSLSVRMSSRWAARDLEGKKHWSDVKSISFGISNGDKTSFYDALGDSLSTVAAVLGAVLTYTYTDSTHTDNLYSAVLEPVLGAIAKHTGATGVISGKTWNSLNGSEQLIKGILTPLSNILTQFYKAPASFLVNLVASFGEILEDNALTKIVNDALGIVVNVFDGAAYVIGNSSMLNAPSLVKFLGELLNSKTNGIIKTNFTIKFALPEKDIIVNLLKDIKIGSINMTLGQLVALKSIDWKALASASTAGEKLLLIFSYLVDVALSSPAILGLVKDSAPELVKLLETLDPAQILAMLSAILDVTQSPTEVYWTFKEYAGKLTNTFVYPKGITANEADEAVDNLDKLVQNIFPLLKELGVLDAENLSSVVNGLLFTNENLTKLTTTVYGGIYDAAKKADITALLASIGLDVSPKGVASILMDDSYGKTYSSAAAKLKKAKSWKNVKKLNWGFKDGSSKAQTGFVNALAALLRPVNGVLSIFLAEGKGLDLNLDENSKAEIIKMVKTINVKKSEIGGIKDKDPYGCKLYLEIKNGVLIITIDSNASDKNSTFKLDINGVAATLIDMASESGFGLGTNGYENAIIPLLEAFLCEDVATYDEYLSDYEDAKDNLLIDILNPIVGLVNRVLESPANTLTAVLPNLAYFIDSNGLAQAVSNLLAPITSKNGVIGILDKNGLNVDKLIKQITGKSLGKVVTDALGINAKLNLKLTDLASCNVQVIVIPLVKSILKKNKINIKIPNISFASIASYGKIVKADSAAKNSKGDYERLMVKADKGKMFVALLRYVGDVLIKNATTLNKLLGGIEAIKSNKTIKDILDCVFSSLKVATKDDIVRAVFYFLTQNGAMDSFFDYSNFVTKKYDFTFGNMDEDFCRKLAPMLDGLVGGLLTDKGGLLGLVTDMVYKDDIISSLAVGLYGAVDGVDLGDMGSLTALLAKTNIDFTTSNVASLLTDKRYGKTFSQPARVIAKAGSWKNVKKEDLKWGVKDRESFLNALVAVLRPVYGVVDVLLNNGNLNLFNVLSVPGSNGYTSFIVPLLEAFGVYNIKTQYDYRMDMEKAYDALLLDILNPLMDKVEDILNAPIEMLADILPNLSLFFANNGLLQLIDNLLTPVSALLNAVKPLVNVNVVLDVLGVDVNALLGKIGIKANVKIDVYDLKGTLEPVIGSQSVVSLLNGILGTVKIGGKPLGLVLPEIDWFQLASHGKVVSTTSQVATFGTRIAVESDQDETLIAVLRYLINTINYKDNYDKIVALVGGLLGGAGDSISGVVDQVLGMLKGDADPVIESLVDLLQQIAG